MNMIICQVNYVCILSEVLGKIYLGGGDDEIQDVVVGTSYSHKIILL